jgi:hypothetical protein
VETILNAFLLLSLILSCSLSLLGPGSRKFEFELVEVLDLVVPLLLFLLNRLLNPDSPSPIPRPTFEDIEEVDPFLLCLLVGRTNDSDAYRIIFVSCLPGDQPKPPNRPLSGDIVGKPNEFLMLGSRGDGDRRRGIAFIGDVALFPFDVLGFELGVSVFFLIPRKPRFVSREGEGRGGGPINDVERFRC